MLRCVTRVVKVIILTGSGSQKVGLTLSKYDQLVWTKEAKGREDRTHGEMLNAPLLCLSTDGKDVEIPIPGGVSQHITPLR
jgi:hypothetical protein